MTAPGRLAEVLAGSHRAMRLLDGSPEAAERFAAWFLPAWRGALADDLLLEGFCAWARVLDNECAWRWMTAPTAGGPAIPASAPARCLVGVARIDPADYGWWVPPDPPDRGIPALTWTVCAGDPARALDIVAIDRADPAQWWRRTGTATALPNDCEFMFLGDEARIRLYETPLGWLAGGAAPVSFGHDLDGR